MSPVRLPSEVETPDVPQNISKNNFNEPVRFYSSSILEGFSLDTNRKSKSSQTSSPVITFEIIRCLASILERTVYSSVSPLPSLRCRPWTAMCTICTRFTHFYGYYQSAHVCMCDLREKAWLQNKSNATSNVHFSFFTLLYFTHILSFLLYSQCGGQWKISTNSNSIRVFCFRFFPCLEVHFIKHISLGRSYSPCLKATRLFNCNTVRSTICIIAVTNRVGIYKLIEPEHTDCIIFVKRL